MVSVRQSVVNELDLICEVYYVLAAAFVDPSTDVVFPVLSCLSESITKVMSPFFGL